jgi:heterodisulfide reductase subunit A-like polyferredoxin
MKMNKSVAIVGAGIAGLQAAIELADCGINVHLIDKNDTAGGNAQKLYKMFPTDDCAFCTVSTLLKPGIRKCFYRAGISKHPNINLLVNCDVKEIASSFGNFKVALTQQPRYVNFKCTRCGKCEEVCPVTIPASKWTQIPHKAIYLLANQCIPQKYHIDRDRCPPDCKKCVEACPFEGVIDLNEPKKDIELTVDAIVIATGFQEFDPTPLIPFKYGIYEDVITQIELAQMLDVNGPTGGRLLRPSDNRPVQNLAMIQCVGSRDETFVKYCSSICCSYACKHARIIKEERDPNINVSIIYMDVRTFGMLEKYYRRCRELGVDFLRGRIAEIQQEPDGSLKVCGLDTLLQRSFELKVDLVVLTPALIPHPGSKELIRKMGGEIREEGYVETKLGDKSLTNIKGLFICGTAIAPMDFPSSVTQAKSAAFNVLKMFAEEESANE